MTTKRMGARMWPWLLACGLVGSLGAGCGGDGSSGGTPTDGGGSRPDAGDGGDTAVRIELGTGISAFEPLPERGGTLELTRGPQGGFHVYGAVRFFGLPTDEDALEAWLGDAATLSYTLTRRSDGRSLILPKRVRLRRSRLVRAGETWLRLGDLLIFVPDEYMAPEEVAGTDVRVEAVLSLPDGTELRDGRQVRLVDEVVMPPTR